MKKKLLYAATWMNLEDTMLSEKDKHCMILLIYCTLCSQKLETENRMEVTRG